MFLVNRSVLSPPPSRFYYFLKPPTYYCKYKNTRSGLARIVLGTILLLHSLCRIVRYSSEPNTIYMCVCVQKNVIELTRDLNYLKIVATDQK